MSPQLEIVIILYCSHHHHCHHIITAYFNYSIVTFHCFVIRYIVHALLELSSLPLSLDMTDMSKNLDSIPYDVFYQIASGLDCHDFIHLSRVNQALNKLMRNESIARKTIEVCIFLKSA